MDRSDLYRESKKQTKRKQMKCLIAVKVQPLFINNEANIIEVVHVPGWISFHTHR